MPIETQQLNRRFKEQDRYTDQSSSRSVGSGIPIASSGVDECRRHHPPVFQLHDAAAQSPNGGVLLLPLLTRRNQGALNRAREIGTEP